MRLLGGRQQSHIIMFGSQCKQHLFVHAFNGKVRKL